jgi:hypothetical protein
LAFEEKFSKVHVSAHPGKQDLPSGQNWWLTRQKNLIRIGQFRRFLHLVYVSQTLESELTTAQNV